MPITLDRRHCNLREGWQEAWAQLESARRSKEAFLEERSDGVNLCCLADPFRMGQVFRNILENGLAAGRPPVEIAVRAEAADLGGSVEFLGFRHDVPELLRACDALVSPLANRQLARSATHCES